MKSLSEKSMTTIKKIYKNVNLDKELTIKLLEKNIENSEFGFENNEILELVKNIKLDRKSTRLNSSHLKLSRMPSSA